jgi:hypothetical protein
LNEDELHHFTVAADQQVGRHPQAGALVEFLVCVGRQVPGEQPRDPRTSEFTRWQADAHA